METTTKPTPQSTSSQPGTNVAPTANLATSGQRPAGGETLARATQGAHQAVDAAAAKVAPIVDAVHGKVETAKGAVSTTQEWVSAAREAVQARPFAAIAGALLIGAAYMSLRKR